MSMAETELIPEEPVLSQEELDEAEILAADDAVETLYRNPNDPFGNWIAVSLESAKAGKKVITRYEYAEEYDTDEKKVKGRSLQNVVKSCVAVDAVVTDTDVTVIKQNVIEKIKGA